MRAASQAPVLLGWRVSVEDAGDLRLALLLHEVFKSQAQGEETEPWVAV
jgi:hypothetical protein